MQIKHTVEREDGSVLFQAELTEPQVKFLLGIGINLCLAQGVLPFMSEEDRPFASVMPQESEFPQ